MAETVSHIANHSFGNLSVHQLKVTMGASSATADVTTRLGRVAFAIVTPLQGSAFPSVRYNSAVGNTAIVGMLSIHSATSAGSYTVVAFGPGGV